MNDAASGTAQRKFARAAGLFYLAYIVTFALSTVMQSKPIVWGNADRTAQAIATAQGIFRLGVAMELTAALLFLLAAWSLYATFQPISKNLSLLFLLLNVVGVGIECVNALLHFAASLLFGGDSYLQSFSPDQQHALGLLLLKVSGSGNMVTVLFYGAWLFPLGYLAIRSRLLPKVFGILLLADGISLILCFTQLWFLPGREKWTYPLFPLMFIAECGFGLWLAIKGVRTVTQNTAALEPNG